MRDLSSVEGTGDTRTQAPRPPRHRGLSVIADRFEILDLLGEGGLGSVYQTRDRHTGEEVAVKVVSASSSELEARVDREVRALRVLRLPGVVRLHEELSWGEDHLLVMEVVAGAPFPGPSPPRDERGRVRWADIAETTLALLETLGRVHDFNVVHRDLKPSNVLVDEAGRPTLLDFGLARGDALGETITKSNAIMGTYRYWAPEQARAGRTDARTDLYSLGVMLFEALSGELPRDLDDPAYFMGAPGPPRSLRELVPDAPWSLERALLRLLAADREERFESAVEVIQALRGDDGDSWSAKRIPRLNDFERVDELEGRLRARVATDVGGPRGSGRSRLVRDALDGLGAEAPVTWLAAGSRAFESVAPLVAGLEEMGRCTFAEVSTHIRNQLGARLRAGEIIVADPVAHVDNASARVLADVRAEGALVRVGLDPADLVTRIVEPRELEALFAGPSRLFHLPEDGAAELIRRTGGVQARIDSEVGAWVRSGLASWRGDALVVTRGSLELLASGVVLGAAAGERPERRPPLNRDEEQVLAWVRLAGEHATAPLVAEALDWPAWQAECVVDEMIAKGALGRAGDRIEARVPALLLQSWETQMLQAAHRRVADLVPEDSAARIRHLAIAGDADALVDALLTRVRELERRGQVNRALAALAPTFDLLGGFGSPEQVRRLFAEWVVLALVESSVAAIGPVRARLERSPDLADEPVRLLVEAGHAIARRKVDEARAALDRLAPFSDPRLETRRRVLVILGGRAAAAGNPVDEVLANLDRWQAEAEPGEALARIRGWRGLFLYGKGDYLGAAREHLASAEGRDQQTGRISALVNASASLTEAGDNDRAFALASEALALAAEVRHPIYEAHAEWIRRGALYRACHPLPPDLELVTAAAELDDAIVFGGITLTEAAFAWRATHPEAGALARVASESLRAGGELAGALLAEALAVRAGAVEAATDPAIADDVLRPYPRIAAQRAALLAGADPAAESGGERFEVLGPAEIALP